MTFRVIDRKFRKCLDFRHGVDEGRNQARLKVLQQQREEFQQARRELCGIARLRLRFN